MKRHHVTECYCGVSCIEVYGKRNPTYLCCMTSDEEHELCSSACSNICLYLVFIIDHKSYCVCVV